MSAKFNSFIEYSKTCSRIFQPNMSNILRKCYKDNAAGKHQSTFEWDVTQLLNLDGVQDSKKPYSFIILNTPITNSNMMVPLWKKASLKMVVDGGGNRLYSLIEKWKHDPDVNSLLPTILSGDLDSIHPDILEFYQRKNVLIIHTPDQDKTDFLKALEIVISTTTNNTVIVYCNSIGRLDHIIGNLHTLYLALKDERMQHLNIFLLEGNSLTWLLRPGLHKIYIPQKYWTEKQYCSLLPLGYPCHHISTSGLKYNMHNQTLEFNGLISSCNKFDVSRKESIVSISTEDSVLWTMTIS